MIRSERGIIVEEDNRGPIHKVFIFRKPESIRGLAVYDRERDEIHFNATDGGIRIDPDDTADIAQMCKAIRAKYYGFSAKAFEEEVRKL